MCLNSQICEIHSLVRYSREVLIGTPPPIAPQKWTRGKERSFTGLVPQAGRDRVAVKWTDQKMP